MATDSKTAIFYINLAGTKYSWRAKKDDYKGIDKELGVTLAKDTEDNLVFGVDRPKPVRVRINLAGARPIIRFADPQKIEPLTVKGSLNGKKYNGKNINSVTVVQG
ncbi:hypothetical protein [Gloeothece verrucosa]|uniref:Uncharacterized protein n=1 Tax=Gloeothece verrucosa (strain PCC 7822) TaxID=497965 RepID=E0UAF5_GLOV7|nr:hypothetical protein [Gloeothece verrucosa]ADN12696.1 hypothetical protein Cyan7822_0660 [Gloeothece verrucosa PCC 7822]